MKKQAIGTLAMIMTGLMLITGCAGQSTVTSTQNVGQASEKTGEVSFPLTIKDDAGKIVTLEKKPQKIAAISSTMIGALYAVGGKSITRVEAKGESSLPKEAESAESVGHVNEIDMEKLVALQPDLVIAQMGSHEKYAQILESAKIPVILLQMKSYGDTQEKLRLMGKITGNAAKAEEAVANMENKVASLTKKLPQNPKKVVILYTTSQNISVKLDNSIAGDVAKILKLDNIASGLKAEKTGGENAPFSMEKIVESNPDVILVTTMVTSKELADERIRKDLESNPAWNQLKSVKEKRIYTLPQKFFLTNPGAQYPEAIEYMAKLVYPEVYGNVAN